MQIIGLFSFTIHFFCVDSLEKPTRSRGAKNITNWNGKCSNRNTLKWKPPIKRKKTFPLLRLNRWVDKKTETLNRSTWPATERKRERWLDWESGRGGVWQHAGFWSVVLPHQRGRVRVADRIRFCYYFNCYCLYSLDTAAESRQNDCHKIHTFLLLMYIFMAHNISPT